MTNIHNLFIIISDVLATYVLSPGLLLAIWLDAANVARIRALFYHVVCISCWAVDMTRDRKRDFMWLQLEESCDSGLPQAGPAAAGTSY